MSSLSPDQIVALVAVLLFTATCLAWAAGNARHRG